MEWECKDWSAEHDHMPGPNQGPPILRVHGTVVCPKDGYEVRLNRGTQGTNPGILRLELSVTPPNGGPTVVTEERADLEEPTETEYDQVEVYGDCEALIDVVELNVEK